MNLDRIIAVRNNKTLYRDGNHSVKVFEHGYSQPEVFREAYIQTLMNSLGLDVPKVEQITKINGKTAIVSEFIAGRTLAEIMRDSPEKSEEAVRMIAELQYRIASEKAPIRQLKEYITDSLKEADLCESDLKKLRSALELLPKREVLLHGELTPDNIIISRDGTPYIIDWEYASQGNICYGHAVTCVSLLAEGNELGVKQYLDTVFDKFLTGSEEIVKWMPLAAASLSAGSFGNKKKFLLEHTHSKLSRKVGII
jgi:tRNA A-37 threonylcarbamoyl transferase component Bud32